MQRMWRAERILSTGPERHSAYAIVMRSHVVRGRRTPHGVTSMVAGLFGLVVVAAARFGIAPLFLLALLFLALVLGALLAGLVLLLLFVLMGHGAFSACAAPRRAA